MGNAIVFQGIATGIANAGCARNPRSKKRMRILNWDSPRNSHFDLPKLVLAREKSLYRELVPSEGQSQCRATCHANTTHFFFVTAINE